ncbi:protein SENSITIVITY TO RED LIGHT REDUCED 1-like isoform X1 [Aristolochia californica]|uniref:protein SENSITIVITY TO RED LIGHT REDUCED 1-like isoform X1 n=1 Tax=Aristolochia californica TaxID=171875 RepID=UPI0035E2B323
MSRTISNGIASTVGSCTAENRDGDWTVVVSRHGKHRTRTYNLKAVTPEEPWVPSDSEFDPVRVAKLLQKLESYIKTLENSKFFQTFINQLENPEILNKFSQVLSSERQFLMVIYGIGSIEFYDSPRLQLSLAVLLKRKFEWIGEIEAFDPVISVNESKVLEALGCRVLTINEQGKREASKPTLFFMPHCEASLYDNLIEVNRKAELLNRMVIFGNSFEEYDRCVSISKRNQFAEYARHLLETRRFVEEVQIETVSEEYFRAFNETSWHFFHVDPSMELTEV